MKKGQLMVIEIRSTDLQKLPNLKFSRKRLVGLGLFLLMSSIILGCPNISKVKATSSNDFYVQAPSQPAWERTYGGSGDDRAFYATETNDNGFLIVGSTTSIILGKTVGWIVKTDSTGNALWNRTYNEGYETEFRRVLNIANGFLLVGNTFSLSGDPEGMILRVDDNGNLLWNVTIGGMETYKTMSAAQISDGFVIVGIASSSGGNSSQGWVAKISFDGKLLWNKVYGQSMYCTARAVVPAENGSCIVAGETSSSINGNYAFWFFKLDRDGIVMWNSSYAGPESQGAVALCSADNGYIVVGYVNSVETSSDALIIKIDLNGNLVWTREFGGDNFDMPSDITSLAAGGYAITGFTFSSNNYGRDLWLFQITESGQIVWNCVWGHPGYQEAYCVLQVSTSDFAVFGWISVMGNGSPYHYYAVRLRVEPPEGGGQNTDYLIIGVGSAIVLISGLVVYARTRKTKIV